MAFHFPALPVEVAAPAPGLRRFDVTNGAFAGSITTVLPASAAVSITDHLAPDPATWSKVWRSEIRPTGTAAANRQWITVFDLAPSAAQVAAAKPLTIISGAVTGVLLQSSGGNNATVFGTAAAGTPVAGTISYAVPAVQTQHVITDLTPQAGYTVAVTLSGGNHVVTLTPGGSLHASVNGVLTFAISAIGSLQP